MSQLTQRFNFCQNLTFVFLLIIFLPFSVLAQELNVYGYVEGHETPQPLTASQIEDIKTITHDSIPTWLGIVINMDTDSPELHLIDTNYFKKLPTDYGIHQAYAQHMGIVSGKVDFIASLKADGRPRSIMPFTFYIPNTKLVKNGTEAQWVLQNRRYVFKDNSESFALSLDRSAKLFQESMGGLVSGNPFFIAYEQEKKANGQMSTRRPNFNTPIGQSDIVALKNKSYEIVTEREMAILAGEAPPLIRVHNRNGRAEAFGYLKVVRTEDDINDLTPQHIAVFTSLPDRIPPVAAVVTLEDQTELSHINVLAINRGTLNVAVSQSATGIIPGILQSANQMAQNPVRLSVNEEGISIVHASDIELASFQNQSKKLIGEVKIPAIEIDGAIEVRKTKSTDTPATVGAKAANYGRIESLLGNDIVKPGFAIDFDLYRLIVTQGGQASIENTLILPLIEKVKNGQINPRAANTELEKIQIAIQNAELPPHLITALENLANGPYQYLGDEEKIRFRSSTNCEDLPRFNGAGLYLSKGIRIKHLRRATTKAKSLSKLKEKLLQVVGSLWLPRAFWEREYFSIDHTEASLAVQINPSFTEESANGVIIASFKNGAMNYWVNSQFGEASVTNPLPGEIPESLKFSSDGEDLQTLNNDLLTSMPKLQSRSNINSVFLASNDSLDPSKVEVFAELLLASRTVFNHMVEDKNKYGIDIEFKIMTENGQPRLYLKQARPINLSLGH